MPSLTQLLILLRQVFWIISCLYPISVLCLEIKVSEALIVATFTFIPFIVRFLVGSRNKSYNFINVQPEKKENKPLPDIWFFNDGRNIMAQGNMSSVKFDKHNVRGSSTYSNTRQL